MATEPERLIGLDSAVDRIRDLMQFVGVCRVGMEHASRAVGWLHSLREADECLGKPDRFHKSGSFESALEDAQRDQNFALAELGAGLPYLYSTVTIRLWSILESSIDDLVVTVIRHLPHTKALPAFGDLKGPLVSFAAASADEQAAFLVDLLKERTSASLKPGVGRFESMLDAVGLGGGVPDSPRKALLELSEVRNVIVHRQGKVDGKLIARCPWIHGKAGEPVVITANVFSRYLTATSWYILEVDSRATRLAGGEPSARQIETQDHLASQLVSLMPNHADQSGSAGGGRL